jgi:hypothetical protein
MDRGLISIDNGRVVVTPAADGTVWMTKHGIASLFGCFVAKVVSNIPVILKSGVLDESRAYRFHRYKDGGGVELYNLEMITALAFRIHTRNADIFRRWLMEQAVRPEQTSNSLPPISVFISVRENRLLN